ncbi:hypothetical protein ACYJW8_11545 [Frateuria aurantia]
MTPSNPSQRASRFKMLLIFFIFLAPIFAAAIFNYAGYRPGTNGHGQPISPQRNLVQEHVEVLLDDGSHYPWRDASEPKMTLVALAGPGCASRCIEELTKMAAAKVTLSRNMNRLRLLYIGAPPADLTTDGVRNYWTLGTLQGDALAMFRPSTPDSVSALLVESNGTALAWYPAGFDPTGLRIDLQKVIH